MNPVTDSKPQASGHGRYPRRAQPVRRQIPVLVTMPRSLIVALDEEATQRGLDSRSELVRLACRTLLEKPASA